MKRAIFTIAILALAACGQPEPKSTPKPAPQASQAKPAAPIPKPQTEAKKPTDDRLARVEAEYARYADTPVTHFAAGLTPPEKEMIQYLRRAADLVERLYMLQLNPKNLEWREEIEAHGTDIERALFFRYQVPFCLDDDSPDCSALPSKPRQEIGLTSWPEGMTEDEFEGLTRQINGKELLSPFTVVRRNGHGGFDALPYAGTEEYGNLVRSLAGMLTRAAGVAPDPTLRKFLASRAKALLSDSAFPYDESDYDWIALKGDFEVNVGPYETYRDPRGVKAFFQLYVGREDKELTAELARLRGSLQEMETALSGLVGKDLYRARRLDPRIAIRAVDVWLAAGEGRRDRGAIVAFHLPNRGKAVEEGLYKKVIMVNHSMAFADVARARAEAILARDQIALVDAHADIVNVTFHELAHGFGAFQEMKVKTPAGKTATVQQALKEHAMLLEEAKADALGLWLLAFQRKGGVADEEQAKRRYVSALVHMLGLLQYPLDGTYPRMVAVELGSLMDSGGVVWNAAEGRFGVDFAKMPAAIEELARKVAAIQLTGDETAAKGLVARYVETKPGGAIGLKGPLAAARAVMLDRFKAAGLKSPSLRYEVTGF
ncbi:MAG: hypothetical protein PHU25_22115 [Deltaproteobacteria bacterium]|nr:hypothetical protein [Deltaproteobacteria bacterium]